MRKSAAGSFFLAIFALFNDVHATGQNPTTSHNAGPDVCAFEPKAKVADACASYADLDALNDVLNPYISKLVTKTDFFSYYRLNLYNKKCPFWSDENGLCGNIACAVTTLENEEDVPKIWRAEELSRLEGPKAHHPGRKEQKERPQKPLQGELGENVGESCVVEYDDECEERDYCVPEDEGSGAKGDYVSLVDNPERFTGYAGEGAHQVWDAIYRENCFSKPQSSEQSREAAAEIVSSPFGALSGMKAKAAQDLKSVLKEHGRQLSGTADDQMDFEDECLEKRVFYRVISGMHASISTHLCHDYLNQTTGEWGPNLQCYKERLHDHPERISNLYFNYALVLRAVGKLKDYIQDYTFCTGDTVEDGRTKQFVTALSNALPEGPEIFDERVMFRDNDLSGTGITLKEDFRNRFRNVSRIMDCVGCDKCRLWGKVQTAGYGTALKVLFEFGNGDVDAPKPLLRRTELVALINTLDKISHALKAMERFRKMIEDELIGDTSNVVLPKALIQEKKSRGDVDEDDDIIIHAEDLDKNKPQSKSKDKATIASIFWDEWNNFWKVFNFVVGQWFAIPGKM